MGRECHLSQDCLHFHKRQWIWASESGRRQAQVPLEHLKQSRAELRCVQRILVQNTNVEDLDFHIARVFVCVTMQGGKYPFGCS